MNLWAGLKFGFGRDRRILRRLHMFTTAMAFYEVGLSLDGYVVSGP